MCSNLAALPTAAKKSEIAASNPARMAVATPTGHYRCTNASASWRALPRQTNRGGALEVIEGAPDIEPESDGFYRSARARLDSSGARLTGQTPHLSTPRPAQVLRALRARQPMTKEEYRRGWRNHPGRLNLASRHPRVEGCRIAVFEGNDAAGKGGAIRRVTQALDARQYRGIPIAAPTEEERAHPYLWRFWRDIPRRGRFAIFDRSWYGRVLVERVEGYCSEADWMRAYPEINDLGHSWPPTGISWSSSGSHQQRGAVEALREREKVRSSSQITRGLRNRKKWDARKGGVRQGERTSTHRRPWSSSRRKQSITPAQILRRSRRRRARHQRARKRDWPRWPTINAVRPRVYEATESRGKRRNSGNGDQYVLSGFYPCLSVVSVAESILGFHPRSSAFICG